ncbi:inositol-1-monophosphatase [Escherichia coli]|nr:inositol-1-monophosphatase [Escherichia coli]
MFQWVIDPLDGTTNFIKRLPHFAVSIAVRIKGRTEVAVVYDPMRNELFTATRGQGAQLNGYRLRGSTARDLDGTILATGFPFKAKQYATTYINIVGQTVQRMCRLPSYRFCGAGSGLRRCGSR